MQHRQLLVTHGKAENPKSNIEKSQSNPKVNLDIEEGNPAAGLMQRPRIRAPGALTASAPSSVYLRDEVVYLRDEVVYLGDEVVYLGDEVVYLGDEVVYLRDEVVYLSETRMCTSQRRDQLEETLNMEMKNLPDGELKRVQHGKAENQKSNIEKSQSNPKVNLDIEEGNPAAGLMQRPRMYLIHPATTHEHMNPVNEDLGAESGSGRSDGLSTW
ncbi:unnamed protein product [Boreogadus saida]